MSGRSSPANSGNEGLGTEPAMRLSVRKDLFPEVRLTKLTPVPGTGLDDLERVSCVNLETDFEQSIDDIANQKLVANGIIESPIRSRHRTHKHSKQDVKHSTINGCLPSKKRKKNLCESNHRTPPLKTLPVKGGKNLSLVSSSECQDEDSETELSENSESSEDEVLKCSVKLPIVIQRQSGKPYSHELSQLSTKKRKSNVSSREKRTCVVTPCSGKPRSMLSISSSHSKKKSKNYKKNNRNATYRSQIVDTDNNLKIKIKRTRVDETITPSPISIADLGQRKSKKKRAASPVPSESSGEEYDPSRGDSAAAMSVGAPKPRHPRTKVRKSNTSKNKTEKTEKARASGAVSKSSGPQSPWADRMPAEILTKIFEYVVSSQGTLPAMVRVGRVCRQWHSVSIKPELWKNVDLAQYTSEKCKTDYKLVWLLENRLSKCQSLNIAQWKVCNISWVLACVVDYCSDLVELSVSGWSRITPEQLFELVQGLPKLQRLDLSLTSETGGSGTCLSAASMARLMENFGSRLTHLSLANNKFTALPQILASVAAHCKNLEVLDISGAQATSHPASVPLEALQNGCPKMRVFRAANAQLVLSSATTAQQMETEGWTLLEELSIAAEAATERAAVGEYRLGDEALSRLVRGATALRLLDLRGLQRLTDSGLVRVPAWDLQHLFLGGCNVLRQQNACLELICEKWSHSLIELDLSWASAAKVLDDAVCALVESKNSKLRILNLCGSAVSLESVKKVLKKCLQIESLNLSSCRALPRGMKRLYTGKELQDLKDSFDPEKTKAKEESDEEKGKKKKNVKKTEDEKADVSVERSEDSSTKDIKSDSDPTFQANDPAIDSEKEHQTSPDPKKTIQNTKTDKVLTETEPDMVHKSARDVTPTLLSPSAQSKPDSSSTPTSDSVRVDMNSPSFSPASRPDSQIQTSPEVQNEVVKSNSLWNLGQFKTTPHRSEASPLNRSEIQCKLKHDKFIEQCSPTTSLENKPSPETVGTKQDVKNVNNWNYGSYSPMPRQDSNFSSQRSPYSAQPSPAQPSPYSTQPSPYSAQPSPYSSQPSPYSAQPSPDTSQIVKPDIQKPSPWNTGNFSPMPKHHAPFSPHPSTHTSPDPGPGLKAETLRTSSNKTAGQYSPMSRQDRIHHSPYSPRPSVDNVVYSNKKSPAGIGNFSPMMRPDCHLSSPDRSQTPRAIVSGRPQDTYNRPMNKIPEVIQPVPPPEMHSMWSNVDRFNPISNDPSSSIESLVWSDSALSAEHTLPSRMDNVPQMLNTPLPQSCSALPSFHDSVRRSNDERNDSWTLGQFRVEPPRVQNPFIDQNVNFESLNIGPQSQMLQNYLDDSYIERSRVD